jgi:hypothetical protein
MVSGDIHLVDVKQTPQSELLTPIHCLDARHQPASHLFSFPPNLVQERV